MFYFIIIIVYLYYYFSKTPKNVNYSYNKVMKFNFIFQIYYFQDCLTSLNGNLYQI